MECLGRGSHQYTISGRSGSAINPYRYSKLRLKWAFGLGDAVVARAQPGVAGGRLYVGSQSGAVLIRSTRAVAVFIGHSKLKQPSAVASSLGRLGSANRAAVYFGDQKANVYAVDAPRASWCGNPTWRNTSRP